MESGSRDLPVGTPARLALLFLSNLPFYNASTMRNLVIYLSALSTLAPVWGFRNGPHQLRDLLAFPKYSIDFLNETPLSATDAAKCRAEGVELEDDFTQTRFTGEGARRRLSGNDTNTGEGSRSPAKVNHQSERGICQR